MFKRIDDDIWVAGQITADDVAAFAAQGITLIINNRPDGEEPGQPAAADIAAAAKAAGIRYRHIPVARLDQAQVAEMAKALAQSDGPVLAFCRSGSRSTHLWALARSSQGVGGEELTAKAAAAGYDLAPIARFF